MRTVVTGSRPAELDALIERRRKLGLDGFEICVPDPQGRTVRWFVRAGERHDEVAASFLLALTTADLEPRILAELTAARPRAARTAFGAMVGALQRELGRDRAERAGWQPPTVRTCTG